MKHFLTRCSLIFLLAIILCHASPSLAAESYSQYYIAISDAIMNTKNGDDAKATEAIQQLKGAFKEANKENSKEVDVVNFALKKVEDAKTKEDRLTALTELSKGLHALEKKENPIDENAERNAFYQTISPALERLEQVIQAGDLTKIEAEYNAFNRFWNQKEKPVRELDMGAYGQIETQISFLRLELANDKPNIETLQSTFQKLKQQITDFSNGKKIGSVKEGYSLQTLLDLLTKAQTEIDRKEYLKASGTAKEIIIVWPNVETDIRTKNASLYTKIESDLPIIAGNLTKNSVDAKAIDEQLQYFKQSIQLIQGDQNYSFWDSALILLREGLEALLILIALIAFLRKSNQEHMAKWIYVGAGMGIGLSALAAILMSTIFNSASIATSREMLEGYVGLIAAALMIGVGIWLHRKSTIQTWNSYIAKQMNHAMSKQSVWAMAGISFLSVFREGAETLLFYAGIAPKMETSQFVLGIVLALVILAISAFFLLRASVRIPVHRFFAVATILIYVLAFKIIGISIHTLQLTGDFSTTVVTSLPVIPIIGFYPTAETIVGQGILIILIIGTIVLKSSNKQ